MKVVLPDDFEEEHVNGGMNFDNTGMNFGNTGEDYTQYLDFIRMEPNKDYSKILKLCPHPKLEKYWYTYQFIERKLMAYSLNLGIGQSNTNFLKNIITEIKYKRTQPPEIFIPYLFKTNVIGRVEYMEDIGIDMGGLRPEFFRLMIEEIANNFFSTKEMIESDLNKLAQKKEKIKTRKNKNSPRKRTKSLSLGKKKTPSLSPRAKNNAQVDYEITELEKYDINDICQLDDSSKKLFCKPYKKTKFKQEALGVELTYFIIGVILGCIMSCDNMFPKKIYLGLNLNQNLLFLFSRMDFDFNYLDLIYCFKKDEPSIFQHIEYMEIDLIKEILDKKYIDMLKDDSILPAIYLMSLQLYDKTLKEDFYLSLGVNYVLENNLSMNAIKTIVKGQGISKEIMKNILDKVGFIDNTQDRNADNILIWLRQINEEEPEESVFFKNLHIFWTGSEYVDYTTEYKIDVTDGDGELLPTSSTCFNSLHMLNYNSKETLRRKIHVASENYEGYGMA